MGGGNAFLPRSTGNYPRFCRAALRTTLPAHQHAILEVQHAVGAASQLQVVCHHHQTGALRAHLGEQQVEDDARCLAVEVAGRFVGEDA